MSFVGEHKTAIVFSVAFHAAVAVVLTLSFKLPSQAVALPAPIQGVVVDSSVLKREQQRRDQVARQERERVQRADQERRDAVERDKQEKLAAEQRERDRIADQKRKEPADRDKAEAAKKEQELVAQQKRDQEAKEKREREEAAKRQQAANAQRQREKELADALAAEAAQQEAVRSGVFDKYAMAITDKIERNWNKPLSAQRGLECEVRVEQILTGEVVNVELGRCNGDATVKDSILQAVRKASPLPKPDPPLQVERHLNVTFRPNL